MNNDNSVKKPDGVKNNAKKDTKNKLVHDKRVKGLKAYSIGSCIAIVIALFLLNILLSSMLGSKLVFDVSGTGKNSVSKTTADYIATLPADTSIEIVGLFDEPTSLTSTPYEYIVPLLEDYRDSSDGRISLRYVNPETYPSIISELDPEDMYELQSGDYVIKCGDKIATVNPMNDCFEYDQTYLSYGQYYPTYNKTEYAFTNAIVSLTTPSTKMAYFVTGLQQSEGHTYLSDILSLMSVGSTDIAASDTFTIPDDCSLLVINGANVDITASMSKAIKDYINDGGKLFVSVDYNTNNASVDFVNLNDALSTLNLKIDNSIVCENNSDYLIPYNGQTYPYFFFGSLAASSPVTVSDTNYRVMQSRNICECDNPYSYVTTAPVVVTSDSATVANIDLSTGEFAQSSSNVGAASYNVAMYGTMTDVSVPPEAYVFGTSTFTSDSYISSYSLSDANVSLVKGAVSQLLDTEAAVDVPVEGISDYSLDATKLSNTSSTGMTVVFVVLIPIAFIVVAVVVYKKRKNL